MGAEGRCGMFGLDRVKASSRRRGVEYGNMRSGIWRVDQEVRTGV